MKTSIKRRMMMAGPGICRYCGCTDDYACEEGCWWVDKAHTVCSNDACCDRYIAEHKEQETA
jgi:hypothetical protein